MKKLLLLLTVLLQAGAVYSADLSDAVVEKTLGISGIQHTTSTKTQSGMTYSDTTYKNADGKVLVTLRKGTAEQYALWKQGAGKGALPVSGLGDEAFQYKGVKSVCAKASATAVCASASYAKEAAKMTDAQLQALVKSAL